MKDFKTRVLLNDIQSLIIENTINDFSLSLYPPTPIHTHRHTQEFVFIYSMPDSFLVSTVDYQESMKQ